MEPQDMSNEVLSEIEKDKAIAFVSDPFAVEAVKKYILAVCYKHGTVKAGEPHKGNLNWALQMAWGATSPNGMPRTDEELGQNLRALAYAVQIVESGFKELMELKAVEAPKEDTENPAE